MVHRTHCISLQLLVNQLLGNEKLKKASCSLIHTFFWAESIFKCLGFSKRQLSHSSFPNFVGFKDCIFVHQYSHCPYKMLYIKTKVRCYSIYLRLGMMRLVLSQALSVTHQEPSVRVFRSIKFVLKGTKVQKASATEQNRIIVAECFNKIRITVMTKLLFSVKPEGYGIQVVLFLA